mmetsp:Transcript_12003/g.17598  ORF Transcript_12003/g.17598 Transcript_12003/m.17598 type:complete len:90 (+) Transcript_12003:132-401(+)
MLVWKAFTTLRLFVLWCSLFLTGQRVRKGSSNGNRGPNDGIAFHGFIEQDGGNDNNDDTLGGVEYGRSYGTNTGSKGERKFIVNVKEKS